MIICIVNFNVSTTPGVKMAEGSARKLSDADVKMNGKSFTNDRGETLQRWSLQDMPHEPR